ncbi:integrating conjugative element protein [Nitrogeniibacter aestuarii]|uniref:integrating conjugative element protein n=1 Tax=Nitrogeniibacter aestuarii TaxID=2815343 RepID=UPI001E52A490|nr:integrating conjugative element protein [Nitrogeniibacter aestuarii]
MKKKILPMFVALALLTVADAQAAQTPSSKSSLYYRLGGSSPASRAPNPAATSAKIGLSGVLNLNYSCGQFDISASWSTLMNSFANFGQQISGAVQAGIASLPLYILQRAQPGLYELFQTYSAKAEEMISIATKSCQQMEREILAGENPYQGWVTIAIGDDWKREAQTNQGNITQAADNVGQNDGSKGLPWLGSQAGGGNMDPIRPIGDSIKAAYNVTMMLPISLGDAANYPSNKLSKTFAAPSDAAEFAVDVVGEMYISTCTNTNCPVREVATAIGLIPKYEQEIPTAETQLATLMASAIPSGSDLQDASAPGVEVSRELVEAIRSLPPTERPIAEGRIAQDIALARTVDRGLTIRNLLLTGRTLPEVRANKRATDAIDEAVAQLNRHLDDLMYEVRIRREVVSEPAQALLQDYMRSRSASRATPRRGETDTDTFVGGRVQ